MARLPRPVTMMISDRPEATASSTTYWIIGLSTIGSISFGCAFVAGRNRVPKPAAGKIALRIRIGLAVSFSPENYRERWRLLKKEWGNLRRDSICTGRDGKTGAG